MCDMWYKRRIYHLLHESKGLKCEFYCQKNNICKSVPDWFIKLPMKQSINLKADQHIQHIYFMHIPQDPNRFDNWMRRQFSLSIFFFLAIFIFICCCCCISTSFVLDINGCDISSDINSSLFTDCKWW